MARTRMHADEITTDAALLGRLIDEQFPQWSGLPIGQVDSYGTDHDIYRLGDDLVARLPRIGWATDQAAKEARWLPAMAARLPLAVPVPLAQGQPNGEYPFSWSVCRWLPGRDANGTIGDREQAAADLAGFVAALRGIDTTGARPRGRGGRGAPLAELDEGVRRSVHDLGDRVDGAAVLRRWAESLAAPAWSGPDTWVHGDLLPGNLLVLDGRLSAVIDFGGLNAGDPACDLQPAWNMFAGGSRHRFHRELAADEPARLRGRGWALAQAVIALPYYWDTNPGLVRQARHSLAEVLADTDQRPPGRLGARPGRRTPDAADRP
ncbi:aminoglycoside phosphotransferase family protein [Streptacidiphilus sp. 4-A2]|nr:aminoglycoside phosphotransferase family protein [Streptacidiphilus sp. 4-A2]